MHGGKDCFGIDDELGRAKYMTKRHKTMVCYAFFFIESASRINSDIAIHVKVETQKRHPVPHFMLLKDSNKNISLVSKKKSL